MREINVAMKNYLQITLYACFFITILLVSSCDKKTKKEALTAVEADSLHHAFLVIQDSLNTAWERMIEDDNQKIADAKRLLEEVSYTLQQNLALLLEMRYSNTSMAEPSAIDNYDSASNKVINTIMTVASEHPDFARYPLMKTLVKDIQEANGRVLRQRVSYDYAAKLYNQFLEENNAVLEEVDSLKDLQKKPLFELDS
jgi:cell fate (sporulation/competence/biofilm development) regulator YmcA (YheA/YmcA/DUF963 family)